MYSNARERNFSNSRSRCRAFSITARARQFSTASARKTSFAFTLDRPRRCGADLRRQVTSNYFDVLGVRPIRGRNFLPEEEETADVAMVTENFWQKRMSGDPNVIGRGITLNGVPHTIVGVLPNLPFSWVGPNAEVWTTKPFRFPDFARTMMRGSGVLRVIGRLKPGMTIEQARAALPSLEQSYRAQIPGQDRQLISDDAENTARGHDWKFAAGICDSCSRPLRLCC